MSSLFSRYPVRKFVAGILALEFGCFVGCYVLWNRMLGDRDFRYFMRTNYPSALKAFYKFAPVRLGEGDLETTDLSVWRSQGKLK